MLIYQSVGNDWDGLCTACDWLSEDQLRAALAFAEVNPEHVHARLQREEAVPQQLEKLWREHPATRPPHA